MSRLNSVRAAALSIALAAGSVMVSTPAMASDVAKANIVITTRTDAGTPGQTQAGGTYRVRARVPVACWVRPEATVMAGSGAAGSVVEACNSPGGFTVSANYRPLKASESASLFYGDRQIDLARTGDQILRRSSMATIKRIAYRFGDVTLDEPLVLALTIQPI